MMVSNLMRIGLVTTHLSPEEAETVVTVEKIVDKGTLFHTSLRRDFRISNPRIAVLALKLAMCDEQGALPFKTLTHEYCVKLKAGISAVVVTPDQDPSFAIAGKGEADPLSMRQAIFTAIDMYRHRAEYDAPMGNPLPKLYHEKREDGDKARFSVRAKDLFKTPLEK